MRGGILTATYRILAFDGGGVRGALTAALLQRLADEFPSLLATTDLFAGTSAGSFLALGLASGHSPAEVANLFSPDHGRFIFTPKFPPLVRPKHGNKRLTAVLRAVFPSELRLRDLARGVLALSFRVIGPRGGSWRPVYFNNYPRSLTGDEPVLDVAVASSAAPIYFPSFGDHRDGGGGANNPSTAAIAVAADAQAGQQKLADIALLSLGTGFSPLRLTADRAQGGALQWALCSNPPLPLLSVLTDGVIAADTPYSSQLLGDRCHRLNPELPESIALDDHGRIPDLIALAKAVDLAPTADWLHRHWFAGRK